MLLDVIGLVLIIIAVFGFLISLNGRSNGQILKFITIHWAKLSSQLL